MRRKAILIALAMVAATVTATGAAGAAQVDGTPGNDTLSGTDGNDRIYGKGGDDRLSDRAGNDELYGQGGDDYLKDSAGNNLLSGGAGNDSLISSIGAFSDDDPTRDVVVGGAGEDYVNAVDGVRDEIRCGPGKDEVLFDLLIDRVAGDCEIKKPRLYLPIP